MVLTEKVTREKLLAAVTAAIVLGAVVFTVIIEPQLDRRKARLARMDQLQLKLIKMKRDMLVKDRIDRFYSEIEPLIASNGTDQQEISAFARELAELYSKLNVKTNSINILPIANEEFYRRLSIKIKMQGHIRNIVDFILSVEKHVSPIRIEQFDITAREIADNVQMSFTITKVIAGQSM